MALRFVVGLIIGLAMLGTVACSDDDDNGGGSTGSANTGAQPPASSPDYCDELDNVRADVDALESAVVSVNRAAAEAAVNDLQTDLTQLRDEVRSGDANDAVDQAAADLVSAVEGLETTLRQASQGDTSLTGVVQELETEIPAIMSSLDQLQEEARCN